MTTGSIQTLPDNTCHCRGGSRDGLSKENRADLYGQPCAYFEGGYIYPSACAGTGRASVAGSPFFGKRNLIQMIGSINSMAVNGT